MAEITVSTNARNPIIIEGINPTSDSLKLMRLCVIEGSIKQMTNTINDKIINKIPVTKPAIFIEKSSFHWIVLKNAKTFHEDI